MNEVGNDKIGLESIEDNRIYKLVKKMLLRMWDIHGMRAAIAPMTTYNNTVEYEAKTIIDAADSISYSENQLKAMEGFSSSANSVRQSIIEKGIWFDIIKKAQELGFEVPKMNTNFQEELIKFFLKCLSGDDCVKSRKQWNLFKTLFKTDDWQFATEAELTQLIAKSQKIAFALAKNYTPKIDANNMDRECENYVKYVIENFNLLNQSYYEIGSEILDIAIKNRGVEKIRRECPNMVRLLCICWVTGFSNAKSERDGKAALSVRFVIFDYIFYIVVFGNNIHF